MAKSPSRKSPSTKGNARKGGSRAPKRTPKSAPAKGPKPPGVISSIVELLSAASKEKPITKDQLVERLAKRFPDRDPKAMRVTCNVQLGSRIERERGIKLHKSEDGYWAT
jgi:hypothetical protein